jgi:hypothetical protein
MNKKEQLHEVYNKWLMYTEFYKIAVRFNSPDTEEYRVKKEVAYSQYINELVEY